MDIITGYTGEKHVTSEQDRDINIGICGSESYVLQTGTRMEAEVYSNNEIKIRDGVIIHQGCAASIKKNTYDPITIMNGSQGMKRIDLIVARYERNNDTGIESMNLIALQGTPEETNPAVPEYVSGDIQAGDAVADMPMYQVIIDGLNITEVKKVCKEVGNLAQMKNEIDELNRKLLLDGDYEFRMIAPCVYGQSYSRPFCPINIIDPDRYSISIKQVTIEGMGDITSSCSIEKIKQNGITLKSTYNSSTNPIAVVLTITPK